MRMIGFLVSAVATVVLLSTPAIAAGENEARQQLVAVLEGLNQNSFDRFHRATDDEDLMTRIFAGRVIDQSVKRPVLQDFDATIESLFVASFPESKTDILATLLDFQWSGNEGRAVVRYAASGYRYSYHVYELTMNPGGRLLIVDWIDYYQGNRFSDEAGTALVTAMPSGPATRNLLKNSSLDDAQVFQASELFKAVRDKDSERFFKIHDGLDDQLKTTGVIARLSLQTAMRLRDRTRIAAAEKRLLEVFPNDALHSLMLMDFYLPTRQYGKAIVALERLQQDLGIEDGAIGSLKSMAALADGDVDRAEAFAVEATQAEPSLEVGWWSLLRTRTRAGDVVGAIEAVSRLEEEFGHNLDPQTLRKDRFLGALADEPEYLEWRADRR